MLSQEITPERQALLDQIKAQYPYLIDRATYGKKITRAAMGAKNVKRLLSAAFPHIPFQVSSEHYSGGSSIVAYWPGYSGAPTAQQVDSLIRDNFSSARFDGMTDSSEYDGDPWRCAFRDLFGGASHVRSTVSGVTPEEEAAWCKKRLEKSTPAAKTNRGSRMRL